MIQRQIVLLLLICLVIACQSTAQEQFFEAETAGISGGARVYDCPNCSGQKKVGGIGDLSNGTVTFTIDAPKDGLYPLTIYFVVSDDRSLNVHVNQQEAVQKIIFHHNGRKNAADQQQIWVSLKAGTNKVSFDNPVEGAAELDRIGFTAEPIASLTFHGKVTDPAGKPVAQARVQLRGAAEQIAYTNNAGLYSLPYLPDGNYVLTVHAKGLLFHPKAVDKQQEGQSITFTGERLTAKPTDIKQSVFGQWQIRYHAVTGMVDFYFKNKLLLGNCYAEVHLPEILTSRDYSAHQLVKKNFTDQLGNGCLFTLRSSKKGLPVMVREFRVYENAPYLLANVAVQSDHDLTTGYMAPLLSENPVSQLAGHVTNVLFMPFDNDKWIRYVSFPLEQEVTSHEVSVLYDQQQQNGLVIGSVDHDVWKTGVTISASHKMLDRLEVFAGYTSNTSRDVLAHGKVTGKQLVSPRIFIGAFADWREGIDQYAQVNAAFHATRKWPGGTLFGWNSWGKLQFNLTGKKAVEVSDFISRELQPKSFSNDNITYTGLDAGAEDKTDEELTAFVAACKKNNQVPGAYYGPFADWGRDSTRGIEGTTYTYKDLYLRAHGGLQFIDGAAAIDPTHPGTKARIKKSLDRFKRLGFKFMKLDFLTHASLEADKHFNPQVQTGIQAYNEGMQFIKETLGDSIYINQAISPVFPANYAHSRRISCDVFGDRGRIEYMLNALTYGWWQTDVYLYNDADHVVLDGYSEAENRSRVSSAVITGIYIAGDDFSEAGPKEGKERAAKYLTNPAVNDIARIGRSFKPVWPAEGGKAAELFFQSSGQYLYLVLFNYGTAPKEYKVPVTALGLKNNTPLRYEELWTGEKKQVTNTITENIPAADVRILRFVIQ